MIRHSLLLTFILVVIGSGAQCQEHFVIKDVQPDWLVFTEGSYASFSDSKEPTRTIYFWLQPSGYKGDYLVLRSSGTFSVLLNGKLILDQRKSSTLSIDSVGKIFPNSAFFLTIHQEKEISQESLVTHICSKALLRKDDEGERVTLRKDTYFRDFVITTVLVLLIFLISVFRLNPRLSSDYLSAPKIFSLRDNEVDQFYYRLTSGNILFYVFTSMVIAFYLIILGQFVDVEISAIKLSGYPDSLLAWLKISLVIFVLLFVKMFIVYVVASLFGVGDIAGFHFFNFIRLLLVFMCLLTMVLVAYYVLHGQQKSFYGFLYGLVSWVLGGWVILLFLKLTNRVTYSVFHLFSYICATEIIPFLIIVKILNE
jgi:hypothetical protein